MKFKLTFTVILEGAKGEKEQTLEVTGEQLLLATLEAIKASRFVVQSTLTIEQI